MTLIELATKAKESKYRIALLASETKIKQFLL
ncbi:hypothetical protein CIY_18260 [Butyrivibrio fibrisolvens 16/4]|nr:hypothetical protein CIY_18260 [Butyrivibrio fibrisolvens 16/4]